MAARELSRAARWSLVGGIAVLAFGSYWRMSAPAPDAAVEQGSGRTAVHGATMGTTWNVTVTGAGQEAAVAELVQHTLDAIEQRMSTYREDSELSRWNAAPAGQEPPLSDALQAVFDIARDVGTRSGGAFDVTVGPLVDAWGFGPAGEGAAPAAERIAELLRHTGPGALRRAGPLLHKRDAAVHCDLSAVAKGYAVDRVAEELAQAGHADYLVEVGGELRASGRRPDGAPWRVAIERPLIGRREVMTTLPLLDLGMATSGDYRNFRELDGARRSHILDPRTGYPAEHGVASVTVLHAQTAYADAWATALSVLGPDMGMRLAEREQLATLMVVRQTGDTLRALRSSALRAYLDAAGETTTSEQD